MPSLIVFVFVGLAAQLVDGSLGMAYGVTSSTLLVASGVAPAMASASVHFAEVGTTLASGASHWRFGNVDWRTVLMLGVPGRLALTQGPPSSPIFRQRLPDPGCRQSSSCWCVPHSAICPERHSDRPPPSRLQIQVSGSPWTIRRFHRCKRRRWMGAGCYSDHAHIWPYRATQGDRLRLRQRVPRLGPASLGFLINLGSQGIDWPIAGALLLGG